MVMPRSRSSSFESMTRSTTGWLALNMPLCRSMASTSVVLPWSTWAMMAMLRMLGFTGSPGRPAAVDQNRMAGNERRRRRCQEHDHPGYVHRLADTVQGRDALDHVSAERRFRQRLFGARRGDERGRHGIHRDVVPAPLDGQTLGQVRDGRLAHAVYRFRRQRHKPGLGAHIDDAPPILANHDASGSLAGKERPSQIQVNGLVELVLWHVLGEMVKASPGVVHQDVEPSEMRDRVIHGAEDLVEAGHVH